MRWVKIGDGVRILEEDLSHQSYTIRGRRIYISLPGLGFLGDDVSCVTKNL
jgi:hypothetical protein